MLASWHAEAPSGMHLRFFSSWPGPALAVASAECIANPENTLSPCVHRSCQRPTGLRPEPSLWCKEIQGWPSDVRHPRTPDTTSRAIARPPVLGVQAVNEGSRIIVPPNHPHAGILASRLKHLAKTYLPHASPTAKIALKRSLKHAVRPPRPKIRCICKLLCRA